MDDETRQSALFRTSHITILLSYTFFSVILIGESLLLGWEIWALILIAIALLLSWFIHIRQKLPDDMRLWIYSILMMGTFFFYGSHITSTYDLCPTMCIVILIYTMTGYKHLVVLCQVTYYMTMCYALIALYRSGFEFNSLEVTRSLLHLSLIFVAGWISRTIIDKWEEMIGRSRDEVAFLKDATARLNDFLANVSHEIRTPVNVIIGLAGVSLEKEDDPGIREDLNSIGEAGKRVADQISDILDYSEIDRKDLARNEEDYMLSSILNDLVSKLRPYKKSNLEMIIDVDPAVPQVMHSDAGKLKKILWHLCMNGIKYTKEGGIYVRISSIDEPYGINLYIEVKDTGIGMSEEEVERVTEGFYQANSSRTRSGSGLGLGMAIVNGFVSVLGGFMSVESEKGRGTTVRISIPQKVVDPSGCMSIKNKESVCIGAFLRFEKYDNPNVREYYNIMIRNIARGLEAQVHRVSNCDNLKKLHDSVRLTHLFVGGEEYESDRELMEKLAEEMIVIVVANEDFPLSSRAKVHLMEKPFYCFPVVTVLNMSKEEFEKGRGRLKFPDVHALVVDDEPMNLTVARGIFRQYGMTVTTAASGPESVELCSNNEYDVIFMDHMMPGMDGIEAMKRIRAIRRDTPIIALTANAVSTAREMFIKEGFDGFVSKPIELSELERVIRSVLPANKVIHEAYDPSVNDEPSGNKTGSDYGSTLSKAGIDMNVGLHYCQNDPEFYKELIGQFAAEAPERLMVIKGFDSLKDPSYLTIAAHSLKSTSKMIGALSLSEKAKELEVLSKGKREAITDEIISGLTNEYETVLLAIKEFIGQDEKPEPSPKRDYEILEFFPEGVDPAAFDEDEAYDEAYDEDSYSDHEEDDILEFIPRT